MAVTGLSYYETVRLAKDGRRIDVSLTVSPESKDSSGGSWRVEDCRDISDRKRPDQGVRVY